LTHDAEIAPSPQPLVSNVAWLLSQANFALATEMTAALEGLGVSPRAFHVLKTAAGRDLTQVQLAEAVGLDKTTMVVTLDELEAAGLAKRRPSATDRRARVIEVTKAGERKLAQAGEIVERIQADVLEALPTGERKTFVAALARLVSDRLSRPVECAKPVRRRAPRG
jgi:MarR family transcriptional regulator, transcriptional regulator for hemolysin